MHMSVAEVAIIKTTWRVNSLLDCWGWTNSPRYHADRFHTYRNWPNNMDTEVAECAKRSIQEYSQFNSAMRWSMGSQGIQYGKIQIYSTTTCSMLEECRAHLYKLWNKKGFSYLDQVLLMCEMFDPYTTRSARVACAADIKKWQKTAREVTRDK